MKDIKERENLKKKKNVFCFQIQRQTAIQNCQDGMGCLINSKRQFYVLKLSLGALTSSFFGAFYAMGSQCRVHS